MRSTILFLIFTGATLTTGCGAMLQGRTYQAPVAELPARSAAALVEAVTRNARNQQWRLDRVDREAGVVEAMVPEPGQAERARWRFRVRGSRVSVELRREIRTEQGQWVSSKTVCETYAYRAERIQLARVQALLQGSDPAYAALTLL